jgi:Signal transduction histidine kinase involved in nitrogen fixation and metabolism regulation
VVSEKSRNGILNELKEKAEYVENSIERNKNLEDEDTLKTNRAEKNNTPDVRSLFSKVSREQNINFSVFKDEKEVFSSVEELSEIGIMPEILNSRIYNRLNNSGFKEYSNEEELDYCKYISFYKKIQVRDEEYVINVNSAVNKINISITSLDIDIFLFGIYAFASIIIIIIGTILANKISSPIRKLTKATSAVAHGDFNFEVPHEEKGEVQELINGFNIMTKELVKRQTEIAELERETAWKEMARQVAHEIKNPLTPMKLAVQQLIIASKDKHPAFDSIFEKVTATLLNQIDTLNTIASEFSNFARMPNYNLETVDIIPIIKDTINLFLDEKIEIQFSSEISSGIIEGDTSQIRRIIINLFRNSIQAGAAKIKISAAELEDFYIVNVSDNGTGIPEELHGKIFDQNFTTKDKGMGLGLKLASKFMESIGGKIYLKTSSSSGSEFTMQFIKKKIL